MGKWVHRLNDIDPLNRVALCSYCGHVKIRRKGNLFRCAKAIGQYRKTHGYKHKYHESNPGVCSVCRGVVRVAYDHDHLTGHFRGWLCMNCNTALGLVRDNPDRLRTLANYLEANRN